MLLVGGDDAAEGARDVIDSPFDYMEIGSSARHTRHAGAPQIMELSRRYRGTGRIVIAVSSRALQHWLAEPLLA
jgi:hypothetical protein